MAPAVMTPSVMDGQASFRSISIMAAISAPVHAPVPGSGIATNMNRPQNWYFFTVSILLMARFSSFVTRLFSHLLFVRSQAKIFLIKIII